MCAYVNNNCQLTYDLREFLRQRHTINLKLFFRSCHGINYLIFEILKQKLENFTKKHNLAEHPRQNN